MLRKKITIPDRIIKIVKQFKERLASRFPQDILRLVVFGSYVRAKQTPDSDLDILVLTRKKTNRLEKEISDIAYEFMWNHNFQPLLSVEVMGEKHLNFLQEVDSSFYRRLIKEGITI